MVSIAKAAWKGLLIDRYERAPGCIRSTGGHMGNPLAIVFWIYVGWFFQVEPPGVQKCGCRIEYIWRKDAKRKKQTLPVAAVGFLLAILIPALASAHNVNTTDVREWRTPILAVGQGGTGNGTLPLAVTFTVTPPTGWTGVSGRSFVELQSTGTYEGDGIEVRNLVASVRVDGVQVCTVTLRTSVGQTAQTPFTQDLVCPVPSFIGSGSHTFHIIRTAGTVPAFHNAVYVATLAQYQTVTFTQPDTHPEDAQTQSRVNLTMTKVENVHATLNRTETKVSNVHDTVNRTETKIVNVNSKLNLTHSNLLAFWDQFNNTDFGNFTGNLTGDWLNVTTFQTATTEVAQSIDVFLPFLLIVILVVWAEYTRTLVVYILSILGTLITGLFWFDELAWAFAILLGVSVMLVYRAVQTYKEIEDL